MNDLVFEKMRAGGRAARSSAESLYVGVRGILTGKGYRNPVFERVFVSRSPENQIRYLNQARDFIASIRGYLNHAQNLSFLMEDYHPLNHTNLDPEIQAKMFSGVIDEWKEFVVNRDKDYFDWKVQTASGKTKLSLSDFTGKNYQTISTAFVRSDNNSDGLINGFDLPQGMSKLPAGTPVEIVALGFVRSDGSFGSNDIYGVRLTSDLAQRAGAPDGVYFDLVRDNPGVLKYMVESQEELRKARQFLYHK